MPRPSLSLAALGLLAGCSKPGPQQQQAAAPAGVQWAVVVLYNHPKDTAAFEKYYAETHVPLFKSHAQEIDRKSTRLNYSHSQISYAVFCLEKKGNFHYRSYNWRASSL